MYVLLYIFFKLCLYEIQHTCVLIKININCTRLLNYKCVYLTLIVCCVFLIIRFLLNEFHVKAIIVCTNIICNVYLVMI